MDFTETKKQFGEKNEQLTNHKKALLGLITEVGESLEGNSIYEHATLREDPLLIHKQLNLFWCGMQAETSICEIGFNAGHSALLFLLGNTAESLRFTIFDIVLHRYVHVCFEYMKSQYPNVNFELIGGDSVKTVPQFLANNPRFLNTYDIVHVDGGHYVEAAESDMEMAKKLVRLGGLLVVDDTEGEYINSKADDYVKSGCFVEFPIFESRPYTHRILRRIM